MRAAALVLAFAALPALAFQNDIPASQLPAQARETLRLIKHNGPFPYAQDGSTFANREKRLPMRAHGYYREYTVKAAGAGDRGPQRIVAGNGGEFYYTNDHYRTFRRIRE
ncbi:MAG: ribonuclease [Betaproteobacteria bacterium]|nr:ribonuclease [Betaproteobacteria bacterium]